MEPFTHKCMAFAFIILVLMEKYCYGDNGDMQFQRILPILTNSTSLYCTCCISLSHYGDVIISTMASQITSLSIVCSSVCSDADQRKHQSSASLAFVREIHRWAVNSPHKGPVTRKMFPFYDVIMGVGLRRPSNISELGAVSIRKTVLPGMAIPMLKIRRPNGRLIFNIGIAIRR